MGKSRTGKDGAEVSQKLGYTFHWALLRMVWSLSRVRPFENSKSPKLQHYLRKKYAAVPHEVTIMPKKGRLRVQMDESGSAVLSSVVELINSLTTEVFMGSKAHKVWSWLEQDEDTREMAGCAFGERSAAKGEQLWDSLPSVYRQCGGIHTDFCWENATWLSAKPATLNASTRCCESAFHVW